MSGRSRNAVEFFAPATLAAVALLALNDHVLKAAFHNGVTGKLSDIAVCFFLPLYLSALLGLVMGLRPAVRLWIGATVTVVVYTALELCDAAAATLHRILATVGPPFGIHGAWLTRDLTDLLALALVPLAMWYGMARTRRAAARKAAR